jgi:hypothetical protein
MLDKATIKYHDAEKEEPIYSDTEIIDIPLPADFKHNVSDVQETLCHLV